MSFFEFWGERHNPGPVGSLDVHGDGEIRRISVVWAAFRFTITLVAFAGVTLGAALGTGTPEPLYGAVAAAGFLLYLLLGYFVRPKPDMRNMGYLGGLIDDPLRYSDDQNRALLLFAFLLTPGYLLARPAVELFRWVAGETEGH